MTSLTRARPWAEAKFAKFVACDFVAVGGFVKSDGRWHTWMVGLTEAAAG
jgi:hypothetical protein